MSEETTTSSSRIFVKILFQELCSYMGLPRLNQRLKDMYEYTHIHRKIYSKPELLLLLLLLKYEE